MFSSLPQIWKTCLDYRQQPQVLCRGLRVVWAALSLNKLLFVVLVSAPANASEHPLFEKGTSTYKTFCSHCHGLDMVNPGTSSYDLRKWPLDQRDRFVEVIKNGKGSMPAWGDILLPEEIDALWVYVATRGGKQPFPQPTDDGKSGSLGEINSASTTPDVALNTITSKVLTACLPLNGGIMSGRRQNGGAGFDYLLLEHIAKQLNLKLETIWFEAELEEENDPVRENYAMLSWPLCDVVPGHPKVAGALGNHLSDRAAPPRWVDRPDDWGHRQVLLKPVAATRAYLRIEMGIVSHSDIGLHTDTRLSELDDITLGLEQGTLAALIARRQAPSAVIAKSETHKPGPGFLWHLENKVFDAALVSIPAYDYHVQQNPISKLVLGAYRHPLGFDIGMAVLESATALRERIDEILVETEQSGTLGKLAEAAGLHYSAAANTVVTPQMNLEQLLAED